MEEIEVLMFFTHNIQWCVQIKMRQTDCKHFKRLHNEVITTSNSNN